MTSGDGAVINASDHL